MVCWNTWLKVEIWLNFWIITYLFRYYYCYYIQWFLLYSMVLIILNEINIFYFSHVHVHLLGIPSVFSLVNLIFKYFVNFVNYWSYYTNIGTNFHFQINLFQNLSKYVVSTVCSEFNILMNKMNSSYQNGFLPDLELSFYLSM